MSSFAHVPLRLYLPLMGHAEPAVRRQAALILYTSYGPGIIAVIRALLKSPEPELREQARQALRTAGEFAGLAAATGPAESLALQCLGSLRVAVNGRPMQPHDWAQTEGGRAGGQKVRATFAYLVHCGARGTSREALAEAVWGGDASPSSVARTLTTLRQALAAAGADEAVEATLTISDERCLLNPEGYHSDVEVFERGCDLAWAVEEDEGLAAAAPLYAQALELYGGPYMADLPRGSGWMLERRETLAGSFFIASERLAEHHFAQGQYDECVRRCQLALDDDAAADDLTVWLLRAYDRLGHRAELEHAFRRYTRAAGLSATPWQTLEDSVAATYRQLANDRAVGS